MELRRGHLDVIAGPMFGGKTEELIRRVRRAAIAGRTVQVFTHAIDRRDRAGTVSSHSGIAFPSAMVASVDELERAVRPDTALVAIDEAQFFGDALVPAVNRLALREIDVTVAGLDVTFTGQPFEPLPALMALAERVDKLTAVCTVCGNDAVFHQRVAPARTPSTAPAPEHVGGLGMYEARCRFHFHPPEPA